MKSWCNIMLHAVVLCLFTQIARAAETDQLSGRRYSAPDSSAQVDAYVGARLEEARARTERRMRPGWDDARLERALMRQVYREFPFDLLHFGAPIEAWMSHGLAFEGYAVETRGPGTGWRYNIYDDYRAAFRMPWREDFPMASIVFFGADLLLDTLVAPTFMTGELRYGSDKWSHFFRLGYRYTLHDAGGADPHGALAYGLDTELGGVGYRTSGAVSFADLASNYSGYLFFRALLSGPRPYFVREGERLIQIRPFLAREWVEPAWDEYYNPNLYRPHTEAVIQLHLKQDREAVCQDYAAWRDTLGRPPEDMRPPEDYVDLTRIAMPPDPFRLDELCAPPSPP